MGFSGWGFGSVLFLKMAIDVGEKEIWGREMKDVWGLGGLFCTWFMFRCAVWGILFGGVLFGEVVL